MSINSSDLKKTAPRAGEIPLPLLGALGLLTALPPAAMDFYLPAFPQMMRDLGTGALGVQLSVTAFLVGGGLGQLVFGPLADRYGRRRPLIAGAAACVAACVVAAAAPNLETLVAARLLAGLAASAGMVLGRAVITDLATGAAAARPLSLMMLIGGLAPVVAPPLGGLLAEPLGWRGLLLVVAALAGLVLVAVLGWVPETYPPELRARHRQAERGAPRESLLTRAYLGNMLAYCFAMSGYMAYIAASSLVFQLVWSASATEYGLLFGIGGIILMGGGATSAALTKRIAPSVLLRRGLQVMLVGALAFAGLVAAEVASVAISVTLFVAIFGLGFVMGNATALALGAVPGAVGRGSAWLGTTQYAFGAAVSALMGVGNGLSAVPLATAVLVSTLLAMACQWAAGGRQSSSTQLV